MSKLAIMMSILLTWLNTVFARALADVIQRLYKDCKKNVALIQRSFYLLNACAICAIFLHNRMQCIYGFGLLLQR